VRRARAVGRLICLSACIAGAGCDVEEDATCGREVTGTAAQWSLAGDQGGYRVERGCTDSAVVVIGSGTRFELDVPPAPPTMERGRAVTQLYFDVLQPRREDLASWVAFSYDTACEEGAMNGVVVVSDWAEVNEVVAIIGGGLTRLGSKERVGVDVRPQLCVGIQ